MKKKVMVAMSGGVDSAVTAAILQEEGYEVVGATIKLFSREEGSCQSKGRSCCSLADVEDARSVATKLGIAHYVFNFTEEFRRDVMERFASGYAKGETPNPCIDCNRYIKFGKLMERAKELDVEYIATGHYANIEREEISGKYLLKKAQDREKDQTYVLYAMGQAELRKTLFPLGPYRKDEVRKIAASRGFINAEKRDSQDICFIPNGKYGEFLENAFHFAIKPGEIVDVDGQVLGMHRGLFLYTIGQRKGLGIGVGVPLYVIGMDRETNRLIVGNKAALNRGGLMAGDIHWISGEAPKSPLKVEVKIRYGRETIPSTLYSIREQQVFISFAAPCRMTAPGQAVVFYDGDTVIGGGTIEM